MIEDDNVPVGPGNAVPESQEGLKLYGCETPRDTDTRRARISRRVETNVHIVAVYCPQHCAYARISRRVETVSWSTARLYEAVSKL